MGLSTFRVLADHPGTRAVIDLALRPRQHLHTAERDQLVFRKPADIALHRFIAALKSPVIHQILKDPLRTQPALDLLPDILVMLLAQTLSPGGRNGTL
jgi:hypothetical protein